MVKSFIRKVILLVWGDPRANLEDCNVTLLLCSDMLITVKVLELKAMATNEYL